MNTVTTKVYADRQKIGFEHRDAIEKIRAAYGHTTSSHAFVSLYLWQEAMELSLLCETDFFAVGYGSPQENKWFFPCGNPRKIHDFLALVGKESPLTLCYLRDCDRLWLEKSFPNRFCFRHAEESDEYIGNVAEYVAAAGSRFSEIRRKLRKLEREHTTDTRKIDAQTLPDALYVARQWYKTEHYTGRQGLSDDRIAEKALNEREKLGIDGIVLYADGAPVGLFAGFPLCGDTVDVLIGKCTPDAPKGTAYYALREYLRNLDPCFTRCNHEEDLGIEGIRQMKESLCPTEKTAMWEAVSI